MIATGLVTARVDDRIVEVAGTSDGVIIRFTRLGDVIAFRGRSRTLLRRVSSIAERTGLRVGFQVGAGTIWYVAPRHGWRLWFLVMLLR